MNGYYYEDDDWSVIFVPYSFVGKIRNNEIYISLNPDTLERLTLAFVNEREIVEENLRLGNWAGFEIGGEGIEEICSLCFNNREQEAGGIAVDICKQVLNIINF